MQLQSFIGSIALIGYIFNFAHTFKSSGSEYKGDLFLNILVLDISKTYILFNCTGNPSSYLFLYYLCIRSKKIHEKLI